MKKTTVIFAILTLLFMLSACGTSGGDAAPHLVRVMLAEGEGYTVEGENPVFVPAGGTAAFRVSVADDWSLMGAGGAEYDSLTDTLTLKNVRYPVTLTPDVMSDSEMVKFFIEPMQKYGVLSADAKQGFIRAGTVVHLRAEPRAGYRFTGWVKGTQSSSSGDVISRETDFLYTVTEDTFLYGGFAKQLSSPRGETMVFAYDANGGVYAETGEERYIYETPKYHIYENSLPAKGYFVREGYQLLEYNTKPDGTGETICPGSKIIADKDEEPFWLYCIWAKETDASAFTYTIDGGSAVITGYSGNDEMLVIPAKLGGKPVTIVRSGALQAQNAHTIVLPEPIRTLENGAVVTSGKFAKLYMHDTVIDVPDDAFTDLSGWKDLRLIAAHTPMFTNQGGGYFVVKWERLADAKRAGKKVLVVVSGSSSLYGLNTKLLEERLGGEYVVVNYGTNAGEQSTAYLEMLSHFLTDGDVVVHAPEIVDGRQTMGSVLLSWKLMRSTEYYFNFWSYLDMRNYTGFFSALTELNTYRVNAKQNYTKTNSIITDWGDHTNTTNLNSDSYHKGSRYQFRVGTISGENQVQLNAAYQRLLDKGVRVYMSCAPCNTNAIIGENRRREVQDAYIASLAESVIVPVISHIGDYILEAKYMYNSDYHPNAHGRDIRTNQLADDLLTYWAAE